MSQFVFENPPLTQTDDGNRIGEYLTRQFLNAEEVFDTINDLEEASPFQGDPRSGMFRYSEGDATDFTSGPGFYGFYNGQWNYIGSGELLTYGALIPGTGNVWTDLNATDFTGQEYAGVDGCASTSLSIKTNGVVFFGHNGVSYIWIGPGGVCVGQGGTYSATSDDLAPIGTGDHSILTNRNQADSHPQTAIGGRGSAGDLEADQIQQDTNLTNHISDGGNPHNTSHTNLSSGIGTNTHDQIDDHIGNVVTDPHPQYRQKGPAMVLAGTVDSFTLNSTDSKLVNYSLSAQWDWPDDNDIDPVTGEITIPEDGIYQFTAHVLGDQGNDNKEEWIELKIDTAGGSNPGRSRIDILEVPTDKTSGRCVQATYTRPAYTNEVYSLYMWASTGLGTFSVEATTFEIRKIADISELSP